MAKKALSQVKEWLKDTVGDRTGMDLVSDTAAQFLWAYKVIDRIDKRDAQNRKPRKPRRAKR